MPKLTPNQFETVQTALVDAYRISSLTQLMRIKLGRTLSDVVNINGDFKTVVFLLLEYLEQVGETRKLLQAVISDPDRKGRTDIHSAFSQILCHASPVTAQTQPQPPPPENYETRVKNVFENQLGMLKAILEKNPELKAFLLKNYRINEASEEAPLEKLLVAFHYDFGSAIALFTRALLEELVDGPRAADLLASMMFLSMCPDYASGLLADTAGNILKVNHKAKRGIAEMLVCWQRGNGAETPKLRNLTGEAAPENFESTPQMAVAQIRANLMARMNIDPNALDAAELLDQELDFRKKIHQPVFVNLTDADEQLLMQLSSIREFRYAILLVGSSKASINPGKLANDELHDMKFENLLQKMISRIKF